jgi:hypothetical protein
VELGHVFTFTKPINTRIWCERTWGEQSCSYMLQAVAHAAIRLNGIFKFDNNYSWFPLIYWILWTYFPAGKRSKPLFTGESDRTPESSQCLVSD